MNDDHLIAIFKLGSKIHMEELIHEGHVYMNTVSYFASLEDGSPRSDGDEGTAYSKNADGATLRMQREDQWLTLGTLHGAIRFRDDALLTPNLYCLHGRMLSEYGQVFELSQLGFGDSYVLFFDANEFFRRLRGAATRSGHKMSWGMVEYVDRRSYSGPMGVFKKFSEHAADREVRVVFLPGSGRPLSLRLGNLSDIAMMGSSTDRLRLDRGRAG
jgi:hypothetical protein